MNKFRNERDMVTGTMEMFFNDKGTHREELEDLDELDISLAKYKFQTWLKNRTPNKSICLRGTKIVF